MSSKVIVKIKMDVNGNKVAQVKAAGFRAFSIQTNGNLPELHKLPPGSVLFCDDGYWVLQQITDYVRQHGAAKQKQALNISQ